MPGPAPKPQGERRRSNAPALGEWLTLPAEGRTAPAPELPECNPDDRPWLDSTREWWVALWAKPQATQWDADTEGVLRLAGLRDRFWRGKSTGADLSETRQLEDRFGLNPKAMLQLRWRIEDPEPEPEKPKRKAPSKDAARRRSAMKVIPGGA